MNDGDRSRFGVAIGLLGEVFNRGISSALVEIHWRALRDFPIGSVERAAERIAQQDQFFPVPVRWRKATLEVLRAQSEAEQEERARSRSLPQDVGSDEDRAEKAKAMIDQLAVRMGWPRPARPKRHLSAVRPDR